MKILQVLPALGQGGVERGTIEIASALTAAGIPNAVASAGGRLVQALDECGSEHLLLPIDKKNPVENQTAAGIEGICSVGTSGESPTLSHDEHHKVIEKTIEFAAGKCKIIAGTGANSTSEAVSLTKAAIAAGGADACLQVTPYYNKPNPRAEPVARS